MMHNAGAATIYYHGNAHGVTTAHGIHGRARGVTTVHGIVITAHHNFAGLTMSKPLAELRTTSYTPTILFCVSCRNTTASVATYCTRARTSCWTPHGHQVARRHLQAQPKSVREALKDPNWRRAMDDEFQALQANQTWRLVDPPAGTHTITGKCVFKHKFNPDGTLARYKA
jgi:hypothetical protein